MLKDKLTKNITTDLLAEMIQKGFTGQDERSNKIDQRLNKIDDKLDKIDKTLIKIQGQLGNKVDQQEFEKMEGRVEYLEKVK